MDRIFITIAGVAIAAFLVISVIAAFETTSRRREVMNHCHYRSRKQLMTGAEKHCFQLLNDIFGQKFYIIPDVKLSALLSHKVGRQNRSAAYSFIDQKTVDFVFCNKQSLRPVCAVKLDTGVQKSKSLGSDPKDMEKFFRSAHLPFVRITDPKKLDRQTIIEEFSRVIYETSILSASGKTKTKVKRLKSTDDSDLEDFDPFAPFGDPDDPDAAA